jgi:hypothetical protein
MLPPLGKIYLILISMKKISTKLIGAALLISLTTIGFAVKAQTTSLNADGAPVAQTATTTTTATADAKAKDGVKADKKPDATTPKGETTEVKAADPDTAWHPQRRLWGYAFGDEYYVGHADAGGRGPETNYSGVAGNRNAFQFRRVYLGYDYEITKKFKAELLLASEPSANTAVSNATTATVQNGDNLVDGKMAFYIKNINLRARDLWNGTDFVIGEMSTPGFALNEAGTNAPTSLSETTWSYRSVEKTITDFHKNNSYDVGAALQGTFDPSTKNFGYVLMVGNNSQASLLAAGAANANTGFYKIFYGDIWAKLFDKKLYIDIYADYAKTSSATVSIPGAEHNMLKIFASYNTKPITIGVEAYTQTFGSGVQNTTTKAYADATAQGFSFWVRGPIVKNLNYFARFDSYNPYTDYNSAYTYAANTNYSSYTPLYKEQFWTGGVDFNPTKNVHFEPNFWLVDYTDQRAAATSGYVLPDHTIVYRLTFFYTFGK